MKSGFVAIVGRPNVGKSSLINVILDYKLSIISPTPQTTRDQIRGIYNDEDSQIVFIDTPGIHKPKQKLGDSLNDSSYKSLKDADLIFFLQPLDEKIGPGDKFIIEKIIDRNPIALMTKLDLSNKDEAKARAKELKALGFKDVVGTSIEMKDSIKHFIDFIKEHLHEGIPYYDREDITDRSSRFIAKEIIRESAIENTRDEIPHSVGVQIDDFVEGTPTRIMATIFIERNSQKGILIGKDGAMIKTIGTSARNKIERIIGEKIFLELKVKVNKNWTNDLKEIKKMGY